MASAAAIRTFLSENTGDIASSLTGSECAMLPATEMGMTEIPS